MVKDSSKAKIMKQGYCPVLLGCNVLHLLRDPVIEPGHMDANAWSLALQWYKHTRETNQQQPNASAKNTCLDQNVSVRTGRNKTTLLPREVLSVPCIGLHLIC